jgi:uncharacterized membrane protein (UPF0136 family)
MGGIPIVQVIAACIAAGYGLIALIGGVLGYVKASSSASLVAGVVSGLLLLVCAALVMRQPFGSLVGAALIAVALGGRFFGVLLQHRTDLPNFFATGPGITAYVMVVGGALVLIAAGLALLAGSVSSSVDS